MADKTFEPPNWKPLEHYAVLRIVFKIRPALKSGLWSGNVHEVRFSSKIAPHYQRDSRNLRRASLALNLFRLWPAGATFCRAFSFIARSASM